MKSAVATRVVPARDNFVYLSKQEMDRDPRSLSLPPRALFYNDKLLPIEALNGLIPGSEMDFTVIEPSSNEEMIDLVLDGFYLQGGAGEIDTVLLMDFFSKSGLDMDACLEKISAAHGKKFGRNRDFYIWSTTLEDEKKRLFVERGLSLRTLFSLKDEPELEKVLSSILSTLRPNSNTVRNLVTFAREVSVRDDVSIPEVFEKIDFSEVLEMDADPKDRLNLLNERLYNLRYPTWSVKKTELKRESDSFRAKTGVEILTPDFAEGNSFEMKFKVRKVEELKKQIAKVEKEEEIISHILEEIKGD